MPDALSKAPPRPGDQAARIRALATLPGAIEPAFQPVVALASGRLVGYEALVRFPGMPSRSPEGWFSRAHDVGLGAELEAAAIRAVLEPAGRPLGSHLAVNVSPSALSSEAVAASLPASLDGIVVELTEHEQVPDDESLAAVLADLRDRGARIALDDTGAGYAGLVQVMRVRPDIVKLDRDLTRAICGDPARMALVESFVRFARDTGTTVCAEGIESLDDLAVLGDLDVEWGQGYALARPSPPWVPVSAVAVQVCRATLERALRHGPADDRLVTAGDRRLERLSARLAGARTRNDLEGALDLIAAELGADSVCLSRWHRAGRSIETMAESGGTRAELFPVDEYPLTQRVIDDRIPAQVLVGDPDADPYEVELMLSLGYRSMMIVPVVSRGESLGIVEAFSHAERPWTRAEISRARIISSQFGSVLQAQFRSPASA